VRETLDIHSVHLLLDRRAVVLIRSGTRSAIVLTMHSLRAVGADLGQSLAIVECYMSPKSRSCSQTPSDPLPAQYASHTVLHLQQEVHDVYIELRCLRTSESAQMYCIASVIVSLTTARPTLNVVRNRHEDARTVHTAIVQARASGVMAAGDAAPGNLGKSADGLVKVSLARNEISQALFCKHAAAE
jgi:hypothetical protein